ncbi:hypothetical protein J6590_030628 [Homalodisca vitripennis]|nr:hypothetical protein J6590_030628 [Homalodisca vitripennis]
MIRYGYRYQVFLLAAKPLSKCCSDHDTTSCNKPMNAPPPLSGNVFLFLDSLISTVRHCVVSSSHTICTKPNAKASRVVLSGMYSQWHNQEEENDEYQGDNILPPGTFQTQSMAAIYCRLARKGFLPSLSIT